MPSPIHTDLLAVAPQVILTLAAGLLLLIEAFLPGLRRALSELGMLAVAGAAWARLALPTPGLVWSGTLRVDELAAFVDLYILAALFLTLWMAGPFLRRNDSERGEFYVLALFAAVGAMVMASAVNLLTVFLGLELLSIPLYVLNAFFRRSVISLEAGLKYFVVGAFASAFVLYGMALLYGATASTDLAVIVAVIAAGAALDPLVAIGLAMVVAGLAFKLAVVPAHAWAPDVYQGSPTPVTAFLSVVPKGAALIVLLRLAEGMDLARLSAGWVVAIAGMAVASQTLGNLIALVQRDVKRMLAYSGIAHMGYALVAVLVGGPDGASAVLVYLVAYTFMNMGAFAALALLSERDDRPHLIRDLEGQGYHRQLAALTLTTCLFSLAGMPPFVGFTAKFAVFRAAVNHGFVWLAVVGVANSLLSAAYYLRVIYALYMKPLPERAPELQPSLPIAATATVAALGVLALGLYPTALLDAAAAVITSITR
ncbi:MAG: NADH-quinone oxidoreductase subunit N [Thermoanaerobaculales bacterium]|nr:NADH-quinone oxidoreductase subunit N [Thermoanaerobaculales bacterium]